MNIADKKCPAIKDKLVLASRPVSELPKRFIIGLLDGYCNLKCPMCFVHGSKKNDIKNIRGIMPFEKACKIFDEIKEFKPQISPNSWTEPFMLKDIKRYILAMKKRDIVVTINTNGLLLTNGLAKFLVDSGIDSIFFSINAITQETFKKICGIEAIDKLKQIIFNLLRIRGSNLYPRIGVSFVEEEKNKHEKENFISYWLQYADVVRVMQLYDVSGKVENAKIKKERIPCGVLYDTMVINHKGDVSLCCIDSFYRTKLGNVFKDGVKKVWHSHQLQQLRHYHETAQYASIPFCKNCDVWSNYLVEETTSDGVLIRRTPVITHYNRLDKLDTWEARRHA